MRGCLDERLQSFHSRDHRSKDSIQSEVDTDANTSGGGHANTHSHTEA